MTSDISAPSTGTRPASHARKAPDRPSPRPRTTPSGTPRAPLSRLTHVSTTLTLDPLPYD